MPGIEVVWNGVSSTDIPELVFSNPVRQLLGGHRGSFLDIPGRRGSWYYPDFRSRRQITLPGFILSDTFPTGRRDAVTALADWADVEGEAHLILGDEPTVFYEAVLTDTGDTEEWRELGTFELTFMVNPYSFALDTSSVLENADDDFSDTIDFDLLTVVLPVIEITPTDGTITAFTLEINGETLSYTGLINMGDTLTINSIAAVVVEGTGVDIELIGVYDPGALVMGYVTGTFPYLQPGANSFHFVRVSGTATDININIRYRKAYRK